MKNGSLRAPKKTAERDSLRTGGEQAVRKLRSGLDPAIGKATQFQPGHCPNPGGRPRTKPLLAALQQELAENPERLIEIVDKVLTHAKNSLGFFCEVRDMLDGKPGLKIEDPDEGALNFQLNVHFVDPVQASHQKLLDDVESGGHRKS